MAAAVYKDKTRQHSTTLKDLYAIINGCKANDRKSQKLLYEHYYGFAFKVVYRYIYRYEKVADVVNDGFVKAFRHFANFKCPDGMEPQKSLMAWLKSIMVHTAIDELRKTHLVPEIGNLPNQADTTVDHQTRADNGLLYKELIDELKKLPPVYRAVFNMYVIDGYTHAEIGAHLGISVGTSKSNLFKARAFLQKIIQKDNQLTGICSL
ncbi:MAG: RNA polymerase sigma factor [Chitinophagaceae bacterium]